MWKLYSYNCYLELRDQFQVYYLKEQNTDHLKTMNYSFYYFWFLNVLSLCYRKIFDYSNFFGLNLYSCY